MDDHLGGQKWCDMNPGRKEKVERSSLNQAYRSIHLDLSYEATTIGKKTSGASFFTQESPQDETERERYDC